MASSAVATSNLKKRVYEHKNGLVDGFTKKYDVHKLVYYEVTGDARTALSRERQMKKWNRLWKIRLVEENNPEWVDLYESLLLRTTWISDYHFGNDGEIRELPS